MHAKGSLAIVKELARRLQTIGQTPIKETEINFQKIKIINVKKKKINKTSKKPKQSKKTNKRNTHPAPLHILEPPQFNFLSFVIYYSILLDASLYLEFKFQRYRC